MVGTVDMHTAVFEDVGKHAVGDGRPYLALDVITNHREALLFEALAPVG